MISWFFVGLVITILLTPGPTNTLLASSGIQSGIRQSLRLIPAEALGYLVAISTWGLIIGTVSKKFPMIPVILKLFSAVYICYLAQKLWRTAAVEDDLLQPLIRPSELFLATLLNPKGLLFATAIFPVYVWQSTTAYTAHMLTFLLLIIPIAFFWIVIGSVLASNKISWLNQCNMQRIASLVLIIFSVPLSYSALTSL